MFVATASGFARVAKAGRRFGNVLFICWCLLLVMGSVASAVGQRLAAGEHHTLAIRPNGTLWAWGANEHGQLGDGTTTQRTSPVQIGLASDWVSVCTDRYGTQATRADGSWWFWGGYDADGGKRGYADSLQRRDPTLLRPSLAPSPSPWKQELRGSLFLKADGTLWVPDASAVSPNDSVPAPGNSFVRLGTSTWRTIVGVKTHAKTYILALNADSTLWTWSPAYHQSGCGCFCQPTEADTVPRQLSSRPWKSLAAAGGTLAALAGDGTLWTFDQGSPSSKPLVQVGTATWRTVDGCNEHFIAIRNDGSLWTWGRKFDYGSYASGIAGDLVKYHGSGSNLQRMSPDTTWQHVAAGPDHMVAMRRDGTVEAWGSNRYGQLGDPARGPVQTLSPVQVGTATNWQGVSLGYNHAVGWRTDGTLWSWGRNEWGQLGDGTCTPRVLPVQVGRATVWQQASAGECRTVALRQNGALWTWGNNEYGLLGIGLRLPFSPVPVNVGQSKWKSVATGAAHSVAVRQDGTLWGWGSCGYGALSNGFRPDNGHHQTRPVCIKPGTNWQRVVANSGQTLAFRTNGTLDGWGAVGPATIVSTLPTPGKKWKEATGGTAHTVTIRADSTLWVWGRNQEGQLGIEPERLEGHFSSVFLQPIPGSSWVSVAAGAAYTLAVRADGTLWAWGQNKDGQLGMGYTSSVEQHPKQVGTATDWKSVAASNTYSAAIKTDGTLWVWGYSAEPPLF
ncbi:hypothetical protein [Hymenobacter edaphi]|uniref:RCC1-like domain-containing protein n=1 Tax=Hymenobacter edaphi TaxID=2211146 RepID=A0A328BMF8_9BACT|nr:hypothetical protein [Hymenobacter edaphi]RAK66188.1 hypothetical protein DLM85_15990 [Hymenobacter edaphi]